MPEKILALVPEDFDLGFKLTGIDTERCGSLQEAKDCLEREFLQPGYGIILVDENFILEFDSHLNKKIQASIKPLIMAIPLKRSLQEETKAKDYFLKMVQEAIGYEIRIK